MRKSVVITGSSGFIGQAIARKVIQHYNVILFDIKPPIQPTLGYAFQGDILNKNQLYQACFGASAVIHAAANPNLWSSRKDQLMAVNFKGTENIIEVCQALAIPKLIHISSDCTLTAPKNPIISEKSQTRLKDMIGPYCQSKWLAEQAVLNANSSSLKTLVINPGVPVGITSQQAPFVQMLEAFAHGQIKGLMKGHIGMVDVDDIARMTLQALNHGQAGNRFLGVSEVWSLEKLFTFVGQELGRQPPRWHVPCWVAKTAAIFQEMGAHWSQKPPLATRAGIYLAQNTHQIDNAFTQDALKVSFKPIAPALTDMIRAIQQPKD